MVSDLKNLFEKGTVIYDKFDIKFSKRFLFESNVVVYLEGSEEFTEEFTQYYKELGFKQLEYELKGV